MGDTHASQKELEIKFMSLLIGEHRSYSSWVWRLIFIFKIQLIYRGKKGREDKRSDADNPYSLHVYLIAVEWCFHVLEPAAAHIVELEISQKNC